MPYFVQYWAYTPVQISAGVRNPSLITVCSMLAVVTGTGVSRIASTVLPGPLASVALVAHRGSLDHRDRRRRRRVGLLLDGLVDRHALLSGEDVLDAGRRRVLAGDRDVLELAGGLGGDDRVGQSVVGRQHAVDLVVGLREHLLIDRQGLLVVPGRHGLVRALDEHACRVQRVEDRVVAVGEQRRVVVRGRAVELRHHRLADAGCGQALDESLALQLADPLVVERDVVVGAASERQPVVVDHFDAVLMREADDRGAAAGVEVDQQDDLGAVGDRLLSLRALSGRISLGVDDRVRHAGGGQRLIQVLAVELLPTHRRLRVGEQHRNLALAGGLRRRAGRAAA